MNRVFKRCLITGIAGSGGSYLAEYILKISPSTKIFGFYRSSGYSKLLKKKYKTKISIKKIDLKDFDTLKKNLRLVNPDVVFHLASNADVRNSFFEPLKFSENNNMITINLLEALRQLKSKSTIIICSTSEVYGNVQKKNMPIKETQQIAPINPYAVTKVFQDLMSQVYEKTFGLNIIVTRMFSYMNARRNNLFQTAFANQVAAIEQGKLKYLRHGNLKSERTIIDTNDAMEAYWLAAKKGKIGEIYNIGCDEGMEYSVMQVAEMIIKRIKKDDPIDKWITYIPDRPFNDKRYYISNQKLKDLGWSVEIDFESGLDALCM